MRLGLLLWPIAVALPLLIQCAVDRMAGNSSETGNPTIVGLLYQPDGITPAIDASIYLRKKNMIADIPDIMVKRFADTSAVARTNSDGTFAIDSIDTGVYIIEGADGGNNFAIIDPVWVKYADSTLILPPDTLKPAGAIKGTIRLPEGGDPRKVFVLAFGLDRFAMTDTDGAFIFKRLAEGTYHLRIMSILDNYEVFDTTDVRVLSAETTDIGVIDLPYTGIPTLRNVTIAYDTLKQWVTLRWNRPAATLVKSFNIHRRAIDPVTAIFTQLNLFPFADTVFIDSLCEQNRTYEYRIVAMDSSAKEGERSAPVIVRIAQYDVAPKDFAIVYDTVNQAITLNWENPDTTRVTGYNVYRRNVDRGETFWTPYNNKPIEATTFIDSTFPLCPDCNSNDMDLNNIKEPTYEYCVAALIKSIREGKRSEGKSIRIRLNNIAPIGVRFTYDTLEQTVRLSWGGPDTGIVKGFNVFRRSIGDEKLLSQINRMPICDTFYIDSTGGQNRMYEYRIASIVKNNRAEIKSAGVNVCFIASFIVADSMVVVGSGPGELREPNDIAISANGDIYLVDQDNCRIQVFDSTLHIVRQIGGGILHIPLKVCVDDLGNVFVADFVAQSDRYSIFAFTASGLPIDTLLDSSTIYDIDTRDSSLYVLKADRSVSTYSYNGTKKRSWQMSDQAGGTWIASGKSNKIFVSTGRASLDINKVMVFDTTGTKLSSFTFSDYPCAMAFDETKQLLYVVGYNATRGSVLHVVDAGNSEKANYKIQSNDQNIAIGLQTNGDVVIVLKEESKIFRLKPQLQ